MRTQTLVQLTDELLAALDERAARRAVSRSHLIREAIEAYVAADHDAEITRRICQGYDRHPQHVPDAWGDPHQWAAAHSRELHQRLDAEEREAGHAPW